MKREDLVKLGLTEEALEKAGLKDDVIDKIMALHGKDVNGFKTSVDNMTTEVGQLQEQLEAANAQIAKFEELKPEDLKQSVANWKAKAEEFEQAAKDAKTEAETRIQKIRFDSDLSETLKNDFGAKDPADILPHLKLDAIQRGEDGTGFIGLKEQVESLSASKEYLFISAEEDETIPRITTKTKGKTTSASAFESAVMEGAGIPPAKE